MREAMFFPSDNRMEELTSQQWLVLRAATRPGVFTEVAKAEFMRRLSDDPELLALAPTLFGTDYQLIASLPDEIRIHIVQLMQLAYKRRIRPADPQVKAM